MGLTATKLLINNIRNHHLWLGSQRKSPGYDKKLERGIELGSLWVLEGLQKLKAKAGAGALGRENCVSCFHHRTLQHGLPLTSLKTLGKFFFFFFFVSVSQFVFYLFIYFYLWLCWVFVSVRGLSLVAASGGHSSSQCAGLSLSRPLLLRSTGSRRAGSVIVAHGPSRSAACGIFPDQGSNPCPLHWQADSQPLRHQGSPNFFFFLQKF